MEKIKIITDSSADLPKEVFDKLDITVLPLRINFGEDSYFDGVDITRDVMFKRIEEDTSVFPNTSQVTPVRFEEAFRKYLSEGYDKILCINLSSGMSGTYQSACLAKNMIDSDDIYVMDSRNVTSGLALLAYRAALLRDQGKSFNEIIEDLESKKSTISSSLCFESLDNLVKGGRIPKTVSVVTGVLGIKLILEVKDGLMSVKDKVRGGKKAAKKIIKDLEELGHLEGMPVILLNVNNVEVYNIIKEYLEENNIEYIDAEVGCTVGIHSGDNATGLFFYSNK
ncbi:MAG: DegV family protein [Clostridium sp.]|uniref:DegV family protein n=1 Tax=Clostridium sp. DSM 8431 TaxID=1761781 RepID=UPI0008F2638D|nr:DegV family protein [Clostridium sp. DSM 8431]MCR4943152.1 DegV family protein [Clostridium sp.]SFU47314.1 EDD domain protein, DegV family [Clostridium sp. DSM 8431]